ncbi:hypothetical protein COCMIDRAFT_98474 [Bipolaris oryzae ATCC 44560]|uniref:Uncharacterized protein n=1 Tax=Bipolaris oryzae ATCC 44560 TaxID=930090 RepID=W6Z322_COCMI|nr:uncharacterized protein COCMIDRAFT_98474 [Bipolaris oryzae ATCC 44560]EUC44330.1 hypothetical protein COCMIDRAFT_98474 [Bipolaris oryzae ATCC 44560]
MFFLSYDDDDDDGDDDDDRDCGEETNVVCTCIHSSQERNAGVFFCSIGCVGGRGGKCKRKMHGAAAVAAAVEKERTGGDTYRRSGLIFDQCMYMYEGGYYVCKYASFLVRLAVAWILSLHSISLHIRGYEQTKEKKGRRKQVFIPV